MEKDELYIKTLKEAGLRLTPQRVAVCRYLARTDEHPTAQQIYEKVQQQNPSLSLATVYNTLETLVNLGVVNDLGTAGDGKVHYDGDTGPHVNLACTICHQVIDLPSDHIPALHQEVAENSGYIIKGARVLYYGWCPECQREQVDNPEGYAAD
jgi:Fur family transcriptional regulator, peroxide stress response regulator